MADLVSTRTTDMTEPLTEKAAALRARLVRNFDEVPLNREVLEPLYDGHGARLAAGTAARKLGASIDIVPPGKRSCPYHAHHAQEEMFVILEGSGTLRVAGENVPVHAGDVVFIPPGPEYPHQLINTSDAPMKYLSVSTKDSPELVEYPDSGKYLMTARVEGQDTSFARMHRAETDLDYWDGEP
jgi:uncharacterized cupin superfamily protein